METDKPDDSDAWMTTEAAAAYVGASSRALSRKLKKLWKARPVGLGKYGRQWRAKRAFLDRLIGGGKG